MSEHIAVLIFSTPAFLWDGINQLSGSLELWDTKVLFRLDGFQKSHLLLSIPLSTIEKVETFLVFDLARNGLRIQNKNGEHDFFVIEDLDQFKTRLIQAMALIEEDK